MTTGIVLSVLCLIVVVVIFLLALRPGSFWQKPAAASAPGEAPAAADRVVHGIVIPAQEGTLRIEITYPSGSHTVYYAAPLKRTLIALGPPDAFICETCGGETPMGTCHVCICPVCSRGVPMNLYDKAAGKCRICTGEFHAAGEECSR